LIISECVFSTHKGKSDKKEAKRIKTLFVFAVLFEGRQSRTSMQLWCVVALFLYLVAGSIAEAKSYQVTAQRSYNVPIISSQNRGQSTFTFNYNTAYVPVSSGANKVALYNPFPLSD